MNLSFSLVTAVLGSALFMLALAPLIEHSSFSVRSEAVQSGDWHGSSCSIRSSVASPEGDGEQARAAGFSPESW